MPLRVTSGGPFSVPLSARTLWLSGLLLLAMTFLAYQPVWRAGFIWDDDRFLVDNPLIRQPGGLYQFWFTTAAPDYFPMTSTLLWLEWRLWGSNPLGFHMVNVLLHGLNSVVWWRVLSRLKIPGAWLAAAIFAVHPVNVGSVAWITQHKNTVAMFFCVLTLLWYLTFEDKGGRRWYWLAMGAFALSLLSKTAVAPLPFVLAGLAWWRRGRITGRDLRRITPFLALAAALGLATIWFQYQRNIGSDFVRDDSLWSRLAVAGRAVWFYLFKVLLPVDLAFVYPRWRTGPGNTLAFLPMLLVPAALAVCWRFRRRWGGPCLLALGYFVVMLLPVLGFLNIYFMRYSLVADHWQYFAIMGPIALASAGVVMWLGRWQTKPARAALSGAILLLLGVLTFRQAQVYEGPDSLWTDTLARNPECWLAHYQVGAEQMRRGQFEEAIRHFDEAVRIEPGYPETYNSRAYALAHAGRTDAAIEDYRAAIRINPGYVDALNSLGVLLAMKSETAEAIECFREALRLQPDYVAARVNLGNAFRDRNQLQIAIEHYTEAVRVAPDQAIFRNNLAEALEAEDLLEEAARQYEASLQLVPTDPNTHFRLGRVLARLGRTTEGAAHLTEALRLKPGWAEAEELLRSLNGK